ncbi:dihydroneopterin aldolase [bacterium]|nr:dihydroneopterin aldolase [bacterium]
MRFHARHGALPEERLLGSVFTVNLELKTDCSGAKLQDSLKNAVDYREVYKTVEKVMGDNRFNLIETLAETIAEEILRFFTVEEVTVSVLKHLPPVPGMIDGIEAVITRPKRTD